MKSSPNRGLVLVAGGSGSRMGSSLPKQFMEIAGEPVILITLKKFLMYDPTLEVVIVLPDAYMEYFMTICKNHSFHVKHSLVSGGETRFHSVKNGLLRVQNSDYVAIHDSVRPLIKQEMISTCFNTAEQYGSCIPCVEITESLRIITNKERIPLRREDVIMIQTPQVFHYVRLVKAYKQEYCTQFTDDATVFESDGNSLHYISGNRENIKITRPEDLALAEFYLLREKL